MHDHTWADGPMFVITRAGHAARMEFEAWLAESGLTLDELLPLVGERLSDPTGGDQQETVH